jgi:hypothetical protein
MWHIKLIRKCHCFVETTYSISRWNNVVGINAFFADNPKIIIEYEHVVELVKSKLFKVKAHYGGQKMLSHH